MKKLYKDKNNLIVPSDSSLQKLEKKIAIGEKILALHDLKREIQAYLIKKNTESNFVKNLLSNFYPFTISSLQKYAEQVNWILVSNNRNINWSPQFIAKFKKKLIWSSQTNYYFGLGNEIELNKVYGNTRKSLGTPLLDFLTSNSISSNPEIFWTYDLIKKYANCIGWFGLSGNVNVEWSPSLVDKFGLITQWEKKSGLIITKLATNIGFPWNEEFIKKYYSKKSLSWIFLTRNPSLPWSEKFILNNKDKLRPTDLFSNYGLKWSENLMSFVFELYEKDLSGKKHLCWNNLSANSGFLWNEAFLEKNISKINWQELSKNEGFKWKLNFLENNKDKLDWFYLGFNNNVPWSSTLIDKYESYIYWDTLSANRALPWSFDFYKRYEDKWNENVLILNPGFHQIFLDQVDDELISELFS